RAGELRRGARGARAARGEGGVRRLRWLARVLERALAITGALALVYHLGFEVTWFRTSSMAPCLVGSDRGEPDWALVARLARPRAVYVLGDDAQDSQDSRFTGAIPIADLRGRVVLRLWPPRRIAWIP